MSALFLPVSRRRSLRLLAWAAAGAAGGRLWAEDAAAPAPGGTLDLTWHDEKRSRDVRAKLYLPTKAAAGQRWPVIVFSHGLGGSRNGYGYFGEGMAAEGYLCVHVQHAGSDNEAVKGPRPLEALRKAAMDPANVVNRPLDIQFALDQLTLADKAEKSPLKDRLDLDRIGMAGHSFGAFTTMAIAGEAFGPLAAARAPRLSDPRVKAALAMSTPAPKAGGGEGYAAVKIPVFHMTGTQDTDLAGGAGDPAQRRIPYDRTKAAPAWLLTFQDGDHMVFAGRSTRLSPAQSSRIRLVILRAAQLFWDAHLRGDAAALKTLNEGGLAKEIGPIGTLEHKEPERH